MAEPTEETPLVRPINRRDRHHRLSIDSTGSSKGRLRGLLTKARSRQEADDLARRDTGLENVLHEIENEEKRSTRLFWFSIFCIVNHILGGTITLHFLEGWTFYDAAYFCIVTTTTVGYGDITPARTVSQLYVIYYVIISIGLISYLLAYLVGILLDQQEELLVAAMVGENPEESESAIGEDVGGSDVSGSDIEGGQGYAASSEHSSINEAIFAATERLDLSDYYVLGSSVVTLLVIVVIGVIVFHRLEDMTLVEAIYTTIISATTVGFGDFEPTRNVTKVIMTVWLCFSTIAVGKVVADFTDASVKSKQRAVSRRLLTASMDLASLRSLDADDSGTVDKTEFVTEMLIRTGKVDRKEVNAILMRFEQLDNDHSGEITIEECQL